MVEGRGGWGCCFGSRLWQPLLSLPVPSVCVVRSLPPLLACRLLVNAVAVRLLDGSGTQSFPTCTGQGKTRQICRQVSDLNGAQRDVLASKRASRSATCHCKFVGGRGGGHPLIDKKMFPTVAPAPPTHCFACPNAVCQRCSAGAYLSCSACRGAADAQAGQALAS